ESNIELSGMDFRLDEPRMYRVSGRVTDSISGAVPRNVSISLTPRDSGGNPETVSSGSAYNPADGSFELRDVPSGSYLIRAQLPPRGRPEAGQTPPTPPLAMTLVDVIRADVD